MSIRPNAESARSTSVFTARSSVTSVGWATARRGGGGGRRPVATTAGLLDPAGTPRGGAGGLLWDGAAPTRPRVRGGAEGHGSRPAGGPVRRPPPPVQHRRERDVRREHAI